MLAHARLDEHLTEIGVIVAHELVLVQHVGLPQHALRDGPGVSADLMAAA